MLISYFNIGIECFEKFVVKNIQNEFVEDGEFSYDSIVKEYGEEGIKLIKIRINEEIIKAGEVLGIEDKHLNRFIM